MVDIMNNCGCYHFFLPNSNHVDSARQKDFELDPFVLQWLPKSFPTEPLQYRINSGWHQVEHLGSDNQVQEFKKYRFISYDELEALKVNEQQTASLFDKEGIMKLSYRIEPYLFFSMGIPKVGFMRQRGHHPIKMIGRAHFDDPILLNRNFIFHTVYCTPRPWK